MAMTINTNLSASIANRALTETTRAMDRALARLATGQRVESARDDAASLAIGSRIRSELASLRTRQANIAQANSVMQIAEGLYQRVDDMMVRMRSLATQAQSSNLSSVERAMLDTEYQQLRAEADRLSRNTTFNGNAIFNFDEFNMQATGYSATYSGASGHNTQYALGDFNGDGIVDMVAGRIDGTMGIFLGLGDGTFSTTSNQDMFAGAGSFLSQGFAGDFNGDGKLDVLGFTGSGYFLLAGNGNGTFAVGSITSTASNQSSIVVADLDNNGSLDFAWGDTASATVRVLFNNGDGTFGNLATASGIPFSTRLMAGDVNGDGFVDLVTAGGTQSRLQTYLNTGSRGFTTQASTGTFGANISAGRLFDINGDGNLDAIVGDNASQFHVRLGDGRGGWGTVTTYAMGFTASGLTVSDLNGDGYVDVLAVNGNGTGSNQYQIRYGTASGVFGAAQTYTSNTNMGRIYLTDFNRDGRQDFVVVNGTNVRTLWNTTSEGLNGSVRMSDTGDASQNIAYRLGATVLGSLDENLTYSRITTITNAKSAEAALDRGLNQLRLYRAMAGASMNRLEQANQSIASQVENLENARSAYLDLDVAAEMTKFIALQLTQQAGISMLAQANKTQQMILRLLQGGA
jgi:flagellin